MGMRMTEERIADLERLRIIRGLLYDVTVRGFPERGAFDAALCLAIDRLQEPETETETVTVDDMNYNPVAPVRTYRANVVGRRWVLNEKDRFPHG